MVCETRGGENCSSQEGALATQRENKYYGKFPISRFLSNREIGKKCAWPLAWGAGGCGVDSEDGLSGSLTAERLGGEW